MSNRSGSRECFLSLFLRFYSNSDPDYNSITGHTTIHTFFSYRQKDSEPSKNSCDNFQVTERPIMIEKNFVQA